MNANEKIKRTLREENLYESLVFFALTIGIIYLLMEFKYKNPVIGVFATPLAFLAMAYASLSPNINDRIQPLIPALTPANAARFCAGVSDRAITLGECLYSRG